MKKTLQKKKTTLESFKPRMKAKSWACLQSHSLRINSMRILQIPPFLVWWILDVKESKLLKTAYLTCLGKLLGGNAKQSYM